VTGETAFGGYAPGALGRVVALHARQYGRSHGFGLFFEAKVARELGDFLLRFDAAHDFFRTVSVGGETMGSIAIDGGEAKSDPTGVVAHLRWFILDESLRGRGLGRRLLEDALGFCRARRFRSVYLWTLADLAAAARLYRRSGFRLVEEREGEQWGRRVPEQRLELVLEGPAAR
jgi:GNAT superfamily N-acetyltransferase